MNAPTRRIFSILAATVATIAGTVDAAEPATGLTVYSSLAPGQPRPEMFRSGGRPDGVPGYAIVRDERDVNLSDGRNAIRITDVAALIDHGMTRTPSAGRFDTDNAG